MVAKISQLKQTSTDASKKVSPLLVHPSYKIQDGGVLNLITWIVDL